MGDLGSLPAGFATVTIAPQMQEATMEFIAKQPKQRKKLIEGALQVWWSALRPNQSTNSNPCNSQGEGKLPT